eukprot:TRINITY_DN3798_c0_g4_i3.p1 TRINITY_DN3798_c0_g4~~TRINITY_DN3798_c0_g4_i3.p1  ORF type:complete len:465 (-),score=37.63 TRINITY_DN3798_c0_g4_i3:8-1402(-)
MTLSLLRILSQDCKFLFILSAKAEMRRCGVSINSVDAVFNSSRKKMECYRKLELINTGSVNKIYKVVQKSTGKEFAMKVISTRKVAKKKLKNEVKIMKKLSLPQNLHIVKYETSFIRVDKDECGIVMEYCSGGSLKDLIEKYKKEGKSFLECTILNFMRQILLGVNCIHNNRINHKDLKPANILVDEDGNLKISAFGKSKERLNASRTILSDFDLDTFKNFFCSDDIDSLGYIFHELCCLEPPHNKGGFVESQNELSKKNYDTDLIPAHYSSGLKNAIASIFNIYKASGLSCERILAYKLFTDCFKKYSDKSAYYLENEATNTEKAKYRGDEGAHNHAIGDRYSSEMNSRKTHHFANGDIYEGEWEDGRMNGRGKYFYANGDIYNGEWECGEKNGKGKHFYKNGDKYDGEWEDGKRHGKGEYNRNTNKFSCVDKYYGEWKNDEMDGKGKSVSYTHLTLPTICSV